MPFWICLEGNKLFHPQLTNSFRFSAKTSIFAKYCLIHLLQKARLTLPILLREFKTLNIVSFTGSDKATSVVFVSMPRGFMPLEGTNLNLPKML
jgi:hypothetical protein